MRKAIIDANGDLVNIIEWHPEDSEGWTPPEGCALVDPAPYDVPPVRAEPAPAPTPVDVPTAEDSAAVAELVAEVIAEAPAQSEGIIARWLTKLRGGA